MNRTAGEDAMNRTAGEDACATEESDRSLTLVQMLDF